MATHLFKAEDLPAIHQILISNHWDYFLDPVIDEHGLAIRDEAYFSNEKNHTLVYTDEAGKILGFIHFDNVKNSVGEAPSFTLCVDKDARGKGVGVTLLKDGIKYIFDHFDKIRRIYATTRADNSAMQKTFEALGFRQEARHIKEWEDRQTGTFVDTLGYGLLREEFKAI